MGLKLCLRANGILEGNSSANTTVLSFYNCAKARDGLIVQRGYKYNRPEIPYAVGELARSVLAGETPDQDHRRAFMRYLQKARNLSRNAAQGIFPGKY